MPETPAETIARAAALMRSRAEAASEGPWKSWIETRDHWGGDSIITTSDPDAGDLYVSVGKSYHPKWEADQDHIASWHPLVALAVADWLDTAAGADPGAVLVHALTIARAYLGSADVEP